MLSSNNPMILLLVFATVLTIVSLPFAGVKMNDISSSAAVVAASSEREGSEEDLSIHLATVGFVGILGIMIGRYSFKPSP